MTSLKEQYDIYGYVIVPNLIPNLNTLTSLRNACSRVIAKTRKGEWTRRRTVGKQFPPYDADNPDSWGVQHVMHPHLGEREFVEWYGSDAVINTAVELLECREEDLQMGESAQCSLPFLYLCRWFYSLLYLELFNLLINPIEHSFALSWHRDDVSRHATEEEEQAALAIAHYGVRTFAPFIHINTFIQMVN